MSWGIFETFPYLLPCLVCVTMQTFAFLAVYKGLKDDTPDRRPCMCCRPRGFIEVRREGNQPSGGVPSDGGHSGGVDRNARASRSVLCRLPPVLAITCYGLTALSCKRRRTAHRLTALTHPLHADICFDELIPLWASAQLSDGGLRMSTRDIGFILVGAGVSLIIFTVCIFPFLLGRMTYRTMLFVSNGLGCVFFLVVPTPKLLQNGNQVLFWGALVLIQFLKMCIASLGCVVRAMLWCYGYCGLACGLIAVLVTQVHRCHDHGEQQCPTRVPRQSERHLAERRCAGAIVRPCSRRRGVDAWRQVAHAWP